MHAPMDAFADARRALLAFAAQCGWEEGHSRQVAWLAVTLFDELQPLHGYGAEERFLLEAGAWLHDIGWVEGQHAHHKTAMRMILAAPLPVPARTQVLMALVARYHRKAEPAPSHPYFRDLSPDDQQRIRVLAALIRVADGLDRTHHSLVHELVCHITPTSLVVHCHTHSPAEEECAAALAKGELCAQVFARRVEVICTPG